MTRKEYNYCVEQYADKVYGFALKHIGNSDDANDVVQESFEKLWMKHEEVRQATSKAYLFSIAYHCIIDHHRKVKRMAVEPIDETALTSNGRNLEDRQWIDEGLKRLTEQERSLILLRDYEGYSYEELTELTGLSLSQVKVYLFRARKKFREWLIKVNSVQHVI
ncbi:MAG: RNA polymerase sigma factor [Bacteroidetes bacterium]|nr:RNA polymerase sigma factor [Bacteroidota bacterium]